MRRNANGGGSNLETNLAVNLHLSVKSVSSRPRAALAARSPSSTSPAVKTLLRQSRCAHPAHRLASAPWHYGRLQIFWFGGGRGIVIELQSDQANIVGKLFSVGKLLNFLHELFAQFLSAEIDPLTDAFQ